MEYKMFVGVDVSKETLDVAVMVNAESALERHLRNSVSDIKKLVKEILKMHSIQPSEVVVCMEHTGIYCNHLLNYLTKEKIAVWVENPLAIKAYFGMERGKSDRLDASRIAEYAFAKRNRIRLWAPPRPVLNKLKYLLTIRDRLVKTRATLKASYQEAGGFVDSDLVKADKKISGPIVEKITTQLKIVEKQIQNLIDDDPDLKRLNGLATSVLGVGAIVSAHVIVTTNEFKSINDPRKMACHSGVAPFRYESGKSLRGKAKVSHRANKKLKTLMYLASRAAINAHGELQDYYTRKVKEGKNKMAVLTAVANKIIHRIFACVTNDKKYDRNYIYVLAKP